MNGSMPEFVQAMHEARAHTRKAQAVLRTWGTNGPDLIASAHEMAGHEGFHPDASEARKALVSAYEHLDAAWGDVARMIRAAHRAAAAYEEAEARRASAGSALKL